MNGQANAARDADQHQPSGEPVPAERGNTSEGLFAPHTVSLQSYFYAIAIARSALAAVVPVRAVPTLLRGTGLVSASAAGATRSSMQDNYLSIRFTNKTAFAH